MQPDEIRCFLRVPRWPWWLTISQTAALPEIRSRLPLLDFPFPQLSQQRGRRVGFQHHQVHLDSDVGKPFGNVWRRLSAHLIFNWWTAYAGEDGSSTGQPSLRAVDSKTLSAQTKVGSSVPEMERSTR